MDRFISHRSDTVRRVSWIYHTIRSAFVLWYALLLADLFIFRFSVYRADYVSCRTDSKVQGA